ncbi:MAG: GNAT family N-acetyltransferase/peptidase C39 family protein [Chromatiales bacterium]|nr:GNAT family N-acetyltransferase/peptidase C39 family protein [Chromatiales bacterium]
MSVHTTDRPASDQRATPTWRVRAAVAADVSALVALEQACFDSDRLSRRRFRYMLERAHAALLVAEDAGRVDGYALVLFRQGTSLARLYSLAVSPARRGAGLGRALLHAAQAAATQRDCAYLRLEVRRENAPAVALYRAEGYRPLTVVDDYYEDGADALRMEKALAPPLARARRRVPYYAQTLDFTCGPAALMMAMRALRPRTRLTRSLELRLWREATTIFMASGHGGCGPFGLALAAARRGFRAEVFVNDHAVPLIDSVRSPEKKAVMRLVHEDMLAEIGERAVPVCYESLPTEDLEARFAAGAVPLVLITSYHLYDEKVPHWVVVTGFAEHFVYVHDPWVEEALGGGAVDSADMPIARSDFSRMARFGRAGLQAVVLVSAAD